MSSTANSPTLLRIGDLAAATGASVQAIRYYERQGLIAPVRRRASGYREFAPETITSVRFIRHAQQIGFKLAEIGELLRLRRQVAGGGSQRADAVREAIVAKRDDVLRRMADLDSMRETLDELLDVCDRLCVGGAPADCPIFEAIDHADPPGSIAPAGRLGGSGGRARSASHHP